MTLRASPKPKIWAEQAQMALCLVPALLPGMARQDVVAARGVASWCSPQKKGRPSLMDGGKKV